jgi:hypothetical protein
MRFTPRSFKFAALLASAGFAGLLAISPAKADPIIYDLTSNHCTVQADCGAPGTIFGTVTLNQNGVNVDFDVHLNSPYVYAKTDLADFLLFKFNAIGVVVGDISVNQTVAGQTLAGAAGTFNGDGTGDFGIGIACTTCGNGIQTFSNDLIFHIANATIAELIAPNANGNIFVADIGNSTNGATGPIDASAPHTNVPEPTSLAIFSTALVGLGLLLRGRRHREDAAAV